MCYLRRRHHQRAAWSSHLHDHSTLHATWVEGGMSEDNALEQENTLIRVHFCLNQHPHTLPNVTYLRTSQIPRRSLFRRFGIQRSRISKVLDAPLLKTSSEYGSRLPEGMQWINGSVLPAVYICQVEYR